MPTTKRLMTDTTGQDIVQAIEDLSIAVKPNATDIHMSSSDSTSVAQKINNEIATVADGIAIVAEGDVHAAIAKGQFVYVRNHSTLAQGVYKATAAIGTNATLSTSNLTLDNAGGLNDLQAQITTLNSNITTVENKVDALNATSLKKIWSYYSDTPWGGSYTAPSANSGLLIISDWDGNVNHVGLYIIIFNASSPGSIVVPIKEVEGVTITINALTLAFTTTNSYCGVELLLLP